MGSKNFSPPEGNTQTFLQLYSFSRPLGGGHSRDIMVIYIRISMSVDARQGSKVDADHYCTHTLRRTIISITAHNIN